MSREPTFVSPRRRGSLSSLDIQRREPSGLACLPLPRFCWLTISSPVLHGETATATDLFHTLESPSPSPSPSLGRGVKADEELGPIVCSTDWLMRALGAARHRHEIEVLGRAIRSRG